MVMCVKWLCGSMLCLSNHYVCQMVMCVKSLALFFLLYFNLFSVSSVGKAYLSGWSKDVGAFLILAVAGYSRPEHTDGQPKQATGSISKGL